MGQMGMGELLLIAVVVLLAFGAKRLPEIGRSLGRALREFKASQKQDPDASQQKDS